jgi:NAD(P)-dependent dehydrogenase (short-subunit alcohol dehydrogenase family)
MGSGSTHMPLGGQIAIVTGGGRGIGEGIAKRLSQDGATVEVFDLDGEVSVDLTDERAVAAGVRGVLNRLLHDRHPLPYGGLALSIRLRNSFGLAAEFTRSRTRW